MEIKRSKVVSVQANGTWEGKFGLMYKSEVAFENGDAGEYSSKTREQQKFVVGQEAEYTFTGGNYPKVKPVYQQPQNNPSKGFKKDDNIQKMIVKQSSLKAAVEFDNECSIEDVLKNAQIFYDWVVTDKVIVSQSVNAQTNVKDDLPF